MPYQTIITAPTLAEEFNVSDWLLLDCRGHYLGGKKSYNDFIKRHIPHAYYCSFSEDHISTFDNSSSFTNDSALKPNNMLDCLTETGFKQSSQIIIYDNDSNAFTDILWLQLRSLGCANVAVLQGGFKSWLAHGFEITECNASKNNLM